eukprot:scaffold253058_cov28-Attheya_sp.AAC.1
MSWGEMCGGREVLHSGIPEMKECPQQRENSAASIGTGVLVGVYWECQKVIPRPICGTPEM